MTERRDGSSESVSFERVTRRTSSRTVPGAATATSTGSSMIPVLAVLGVAVLFGTTGTALAKAPVGTDSLAAGTVRLLVGGAALCLIAGRRLSMWREHRAALAVGAVGVAVYQLGFFDATQRTGVAMATVITIAVSPLASRAIGAVRRRPAPAPLWYLAAVMIGIGLVLLVGSGSDRLETDTAGIVAAILAGASYALYTEAGSAAIGAGADSTSTMALLFFGGGLLASPLLFVRDLGWLAEGRGVLVMAWLALVTLTIAYVAFGWGLRTLAPTTVVMLTLLEPAVAAVLAVTFLDERLSGVGWIGAALVLAAMPLVALSARTTVRS